QRNFILEDDTVAGAVLQLLEDSSPVLAQLHHRPDVGGWDDDRQPHERLRYGFDGSRIREHRWVVDLDHAPAPQPNLVLHCRRGGDELELELSLQALLDDLEMEQAQKAAAKAET